MGEWVPSWQGYLKYLKRAESPFGARIGRSFDVAAVIWGITHQRVVQLCNKTWYSEDISIGRCAERVRVPSRFGFASRCMDTIWRRP